MIPVLIEAALRTLLVAAAVWAGLRVLRVSNVLALKAAWGLVLAAALLMPLVMRWQWLPAGAAVVFPAHPIQLALQWLDAERPVLETLRAATAEAHPSPRPSDPLPAEHANEASTPEPAPAPENAEMPTRFPAPAISNSYASEPANSRQGHPEAMGTLRALGKSLLRPAILAWALYLTVLAGLLLRMFYGLAAAAHLWIAAEPIAPNSLPASSTGLAYDLRMRSSRAVSSPVTIGSGVLLPAEYHEWDAEKLRIVLAHEGSHVRQGDFYLQMLAGLYAVMFWFSPLGWWLKRKLSDLSETISDRAGLREAASRSSYAQILLEFAVAPRPTLITGVAMARSSNLSQRIERLLNDTIFRQAFAGGRRRALLAVLLVPVALFGATALVRVEAAGQAGTRPAPQVQPPFASAIQAQEPAPPATPAPAVAPAPPSQPVPEPPDADALPPLPPEPPDADAEGGPGSDTVIVRKRSIRKADRQGTGEGHGEGKQFNFTYRYRYDSKGESYALVTGDGKHLQFSGDWHGGGHEEMEKARQKAHGDFLWFTREGKSYIVDDPAIISQIQAMYAPMEALGKQQEELGRMQAELGRQQELLGGELERAGRPTPDMSKEIAEVESAMAKLKANQGKVMSTEQWADIESKLGDLQGKLGEIQGRIGAMQGEVGGKQGKLGAQQGELGGRQGRIGAEQGRIAEEADRKVKSIIDQSMKNGKARPVE